MEWMMKSYNKPEFKCAALRFFNVFGYGEKHKKKMASSVYQFYEQNKNNFSLITL